MPVRSGWVALGLALCAAGLLRAEAPTIMNYQGRLINGTNLVNGNRALTFSVYGSSGGGSALYRETDTVSVVDGIYSTVVGDNLPAGAVPDWATALGLAGTSAWLGVAVDGTEMLPRERVAAAPYAVHLFNRSPLALKLGEAFVIVDATTNTIGNGNNLRAAYSIATNMTPYGLSRSPSNRVAVLLSPGTYNLGFFQLQLTTEYVDLIGLSSSPDNQHIEGLATVANFGVLRQTADDVRLENLRVHSGRLAGGLNFDSTDPSAYFPNSGTSNTVIRNCKFYGGTNTWAMRLGISYAGRYERCLGGNQSFGGQNGTASGVFIECVGRDNSFGGQNGTASGTFIECAGGNNSFGGYGGLAKGLFRDCEATSDSFGGSYGVATGVFMRCRGTTNCFGGSDGTASGIFSDCSANLYSFGGSFGDAIGTFINCRGDNYCFGARGIASGVFENCIGVFACFGYDVEASGFFRNCRGGVQCFGAYGIASGTFIDCYSEETGFGGRGEASGAFFNCVGGQSSFGSHGGSVASGTFINCVAGAFSFGFEGLAGEPSGIFVDCIGEDLSFGGHGTVSGSVSGQFYRCWLKASSWKGQMAGRMEDCRWEADLTLLDGARVYDCAVAGAITNSGSGNVRLAHNRCRSLLLGNLTNLIGTAYNVIDTDID